MNGIMKNQITERLNIKYPVIQAPMLGVSTPEMAAAVSNNGGLGSLAIGGLSPEVTLSLIRKTRSLTDKPFAVNFFAHNVPAIDERSLGKMRVLLLSIAKKQKFNLKDSDLTGFKFYTYHDQIDLLISENIK